MSAPDGWVTSASTADADYRRDLRISLLGDWVAYLLGQQEAEEHNVPSVDEDLEPGQYLPETGLFNPGDD